MVFDRFLFASVVFPTDYGFIRGAYSAEGEPMDVVITVSERRCCIWRSRGTRDR
jgi:inorganic pyrophosphatase